jgi:hypothetical protein
MAADRDRPRKRRARFSVLGGSICLSALAAISSLRPPSRIPHAEVPDRSKVGRSRNSLIPVPYPISFRARAFQCLGAGCDPFSLRFVSFRIGAFGSKLGSSVNPPLRSGATGQGRAQPFHGGNRGSNPLGTPPLHRANDNQSFFGLIVPPDATAGKSGTLLLLLRASSSGAAEASSLARFAFFV